MSRDFPIVDLKADGDWVQELLDVLKQHKRVLLQNYEATEQNNTRVIQIAMQERLLVRIQAGSFVLERRGGEEGS